MNKFYTLALCAFCGLSVAAQAHQTQDIIEAPASRAASITDFEGEYEWKYVKLQDSNYPTSIDIVVKDASTGEVSIENMFFYPVKAFIKPETGRLFIPNKQYLGVDPEGGGPLYFYIKSLGADGYLTSGVVNTEYSIGTIEGTDITFPNGDVWAFGDYDNEKAGWYMLTMENVFRNDNEPNSNWEDYCTGTFEDGWWTPSMGINPADYPWSVKIQRNVNDHTLFRLDNPYREEDSGFADYVTGSGYINFSLADPEYVLVLPGTYSGLKHSTGAKLYFINFEGYNYAVAGTTKEQMMAQNPGETFSNLQGNVVSIPFCGVTVTKDASSGFVQWKDKNGNDLGHLMEAKITFDQDPGVGGIDNITVDNDNSAAVYYNLQGVRLERPATGINIRVQGGKATKVLVK